MNGKAAVSSEMNRSLEHFRVRASALARLRRPKRRSGKQPPPPGGRLSVPPREEPSPQPLKDFRPHRTNPTKSAWAHTTHKIWVPSSLLGVKNINASVNKKGSFFL